MRRGAPQLKPEPVLVTAVTDEARDVKTFELEERAGERRIARFSRPGNFVMLWLARPADGRVDAGVTDMVPMSVSGADGTRFRVTVKGTGPTSREMLAYREGMSLGVVGPLGNAFRFEPGRRSLVVGGGMGVAPLAFVVSEARREGQEVTVLLGARTDCGLVFERALSGPGQELVITTDDGTKGHKATIPEFLQAGSFIEGFERVYCCGPEMMMAKVLAIAAERGIPGQFSLERYMYCGSGGCGSCTIDGRRVCKDGPVFDSDELLKMPSFGKRARTREGVPVVLEDGPCSPG